MYAQAYANTPIARRRRPRQLLPILTAEIEPTIREPIENVDESMIVEEFDQTHNVYILKETDILETTYRVDESQIEEETALACPLPIFISP